MNTVKNAIGLFAASACMIIFVMMISASAYAAEPISNAGVYESDVHGSVLYFATGAGNDTTQEQAANADLAATQAEAAKKLAAQQTAAQTSLANLNGRQVVSLGRYRLTGYCPCYECSEGHGNMTSTGVRAQAGRTIAVDPRVIPYGSHVLINGHEYVAQDCGGLVKGNHIDIYFNTHKEACNFLTYSEVYLIK